MNLLSPTQIRDADYKKNVVTLDIETAPSFGAFFELYKEGNICWTERQWFIMSMCWKYLGQTKMYSAAIWDFKEWGKSFCSKCKRIENTDEAEKKLMSKLWDVLDKAQLIIGHNSDQFDIKKLNAKFIKYGFEPPSYYQTVDTKKLQKKVAKTDSNKLNDLGEFYGLGTKMETEKDLHKKCLRNDRRAQKQMVEYNKVDVILDEKVYLKLRGWDKNSPNMNVILGGVFNCPACGSNQAQKHGFRYTKTAVYQSFRCLNCGKHSQGDKVSKDKVLK